MSWLLYRQRRCRGSLLVYLIAALLNPEDFS